MTTRSRAPRRAVPGEGLQERPQADLVPGLRRLRRRPGDLPRAGGVGRPPHEIAFVSGIGCSSRIPGYTTAYGFNSVHGRALPIAQGIKLANPDLLVLVAGGDGDGFSIGGGHVAHAVRRNIDLTYIVMDNQIYGLTKGQLSPTSPRGLQDRVLGLRQPGGSGQPAALRARLRRASFVAQGTPADMAGLAAVIEEAIRFPGFAFVNVQSPCVTYGEAEQQLKSQKQKPRAARVGGPRPVEPDRGDGPGAGIRHEALHGRVLPLAPPPAT
jgi:2-oxoglutarate/2-oxoacid ferredoxin oxidoreductase subunit beta